MTITAVDSKKGKTKRQAIIVLAGISLAFGAGYAGYGMHSARAEGVPSGPTMYYSGVLEEEGVAVDGQRLMSLRLYDEVATDANMLCESTPNEAGGSAGEVTVRSGRFRFAVSDECTDVMRANPDVWAELVVEDDALPRAKIGAVPYALEAERATSASRATGGLKRTLDTLSERVGEGESDISETTEALQMSLNALTDRVADEESASETLQMSFNALTDRVADEESASETLQTSLEALAARITSLENNSISASAERAGSGDAFHDDCSSGTGIFGSAGACARMAHRKCRSLGYRTGWMKGEAAGDSITIQCIEDVGS